MARSKRSTIPKPPAGPRIGFWDVFYRNGTAFAVCGVLAYGIYRSNPGDIPLLFKSVFEDDKSAIIGWTVATLLLVTLVAVSFFGRLFYKAEIKRLADLRDELMGRLGLKIESHAHDENK